MLRKMSAQCSCRTERYEAADLTPCECLSATPLYTPACWHARHARCAIRAAAGDYRPALSPRQAQARSSREAAAFTKSLGIDPGGRPPGPETPGRGAQATAPILDSTFSLIPSCDSMSAAGQS